MCGLAGIFVYGSSRDEVDADELMRIREQMIMCAREGGAMCQKLRGMYAFAIWDSIAQSLFVSRDPFGIKPLCDHVSGQQRQLVASLRTEQAQASTAQTSLVSSRN